MRATAAGAVLFLMAGACATSSLAPSDTSPVTLSRGADLYQMNCAACHGADLTGTERGPSHLSVVYAPSHHGDGAFLVAIEVGARAHHWNFGDMPPIEGLTAEDIAAITSFVRSEQELRGLEPYPP